jgi:hypothetical protein
MSTPCARIRRPLLVTAMTDRNDRFSSRERVNNEDLLPGESSLGRTGRTTWVAAKQEAADHGDPTDPEVPTAKRRGERRRQQSLFVLSFVVLGLLSIALFLLYRTSLQVTSARSVAGDAKWLLRQGRQHNASAAVRVGSPSTSVAVPASSAPTLSREAPHGVEGQLTDPARTAASTTPRSRSSAPAPDIFRAPAF